MLYLPQANTSDRPTAVQGEVATVKTHNKDSDTPIHASDEKAAIGNENDVIELSRLG
jgi:hypothetical protein